MTATFQDTNDHRAIATVPAAQVDFCDLLAAKGGFTVTLTGAEPSQGFSVALWPDRSLILESGLGQAALRASIRQWLVGNADLLGTPGVHVGAWRDGETGLIWFDLVRVFSPDEEAEAIEAGRGANQIAIWCLHRAEEIRTGGTGEAS